MDLFEGIRKSYLAEGLSDDEVKCIVAVATVIQFSDMQEIVREFEDADTLFVLLEGRVRVTTSHGDPIARLSAGSLFGESALFRSGPRMATVLSEGDTKMARISADSFNALMDGQPNIGLVVLRNAGKMLCGRLRSANVQLEAVLSAI